MIITRFYRKQIQSLYLFIVHLKYFIDFFVFFQTTRHSDIFEISPRPFSSQLNQNSAGFQYQTIPRTPPPTLLQGERNLPLQQTAFNRPISSVRHQVRFYKLFKLFMFFWEEKDHLIILDLICL